MKKKTSSQFSENSTNTCQLMGPWLLFAITFVAYIIRTSYIRKQAACVLAGCHKIQIRKWKLKMCMQGNIVERETMKYKKINNNYAARFSGKLNECLLFCLSLYTTLFFLSCKCIQFRTKMTHINYELVLATFTLMSNQPEIIEMR